MLRLVTLVISNRKPQESDQDPDCVEENDEEIDMERPPIDTNSPSTTDQPSM